MHPSSFAPMWTVLQEERSEQAMWSVMGKSASDTSARRAERRLARIGERCWRGYARKKTSSCAWYPCCPMAVPAKRLLAIVHAFGLDERTVVRWQERAGEHCQRVHEDQVMRAHLDLEHVQADEIR